MRGDVGEGLDARSVRTVETGPMFADLDDLTSTQGTLVSVSLCDLVSERMRERVTDRDAKNTTLKNIDGQLKKMLSSQ